jgi:hypothetical protein
MNKQTFREVRWFSSPGYIIHTLDDKQLEPIWQEINKIQNGEIRKDNRNNLAGNISREFVLEDCHSHVENIAFGLMDSFEKQTNWMQRNCNSNVENSTIILREAWVNFQKKYEFNPAHNHSGALSFVIWMKIPYTYEEENGDNLANKKSKGAFEFTWADASGNIREDLLPVDSTYEGTMCLFPSKLRHTVYPFYSSDEERITVSGNLYFNNRK